MTSPSPFRDYTNKADQIFFGLTDIQDGLNKAKESGPVTGLDEATRRAFDKLTEDFSKLTKSFSTTRFDLTSKGTIEAKFKLIRGAIGEISKFDLSEPVGRSRAHANAGLTQVESDLKSTSNEKIYGAESTHLALPKVPKKESDMNDVNQLIETFSENGGSEAWDRIFKRVESFVRKDDKILKTELELLGIMEGVNDVLVSKENLMKFRNNLIIFYNYPNIPLK